MDTDVKDKERFSKKIGEKEKRKLKALHEDKRSVWAGLGTFGMVGWSVAVPTVLGIAAGLWLDENYPQPISWTITLLIVGLFIGCLIAWKWVARENKMMHQNKDKKDE
ncbi:MAG: AtpZ/AtpI family protein [Christiangramia sp.]